MPERGAIVRAEVIELTTWDAANNCPFPLRRVAIQFPPLLQAQAHLATATTIYREMDMHFLA